MGKEELYDKITSKIKRYKIMEPSRSDHICLCHTWELDDDRLIIMEPLRSRISLAVMSKNSMKGANLLYIKSTSDWIKAKFLINFMMGAKLI